MPRKSNPDDYTLLSIRVSNCDISVGESLNLNLCTTVPHSWDDSDPVIAPNFRLLLSGTCVYPEHRANCSYEITVYGERLAREQLTFDQIRVRDRHNVPVYRKYRDREYPVFKVPPGLATVESRGARGWRTCLWVAPHTASRMLTLVGLKRTLYVSIDEHKIDRQRWVRGFALQTTDPANE